MNDTEKSERLTKLERDSEAISDKIKRAERVSFWKKFVYFLVITALIYFASSVEFCSKTNSSSKICKIIKFKLSPSAIETEYPIELYINILILSVLAGIILSWFLVGVLTFKRVRSLEKRKDNIDNDYDIEKKRDSLKKNVENGMMLWCTDHINNYFTQVQKQASISFWILAAVALLGILFVIYGVTVATVSAFKLESGWVSYVTGVVIDVGVFGFYLLYNASTANMREYHRDLMRMQHIYLDILLSSSLQEQKRTEYVEKLGSDLRRLYEKTEQEPVQPMLYVLISLFERLASSKKLGHVTTATGKQKNSRSRKTKPLTKKTTKTIPSASPSSP